MVGKNIFKNLILASFLITVSSCCKKETKAAVAEIKDHISINIEKDPTTLDGRKSRLFRDNGLIMMFNDGLFRSGKDGKVAPAIAEKYSVLDDGKTYVIELKQTLWNNGTPVTAHDFIYSWKTSLRKNFPAPGVENLYEIRNAKLIKDGLLPSSMLGVHAKGDYCLVIELERPLPYFTKLLTMPIFLPVSESHEKQYADWTTNLDNYLCNGAFVPTKWKLKDEIVAEKNAYYWDKEQVKLNKITFLMIDQDTAFSMYQNKQVSFIGSPYSYIPEDAASHLKGSKLLRNNEALMTAFIRANVNSHPLNEPDFRKSIASAIDRNTILEHSPRYWSVATGLVPKCMGIQETPYFNDGDNEEARRLLKSACEKLKIKENNLPAISLMMVNIQNRKKLAEIIQDQLKKSLGVDLKLELVEYKVYVDRLKSGNYELALGDWVADFDDPINFLEVFKTKTCSTNNTGWESLDYIGAIESSYHAADVKDRNRALQKAEELFIAEMPIIPLFHKGITSMYDENLKDVVFSDMGTVDFKWAYIEDN